MLLAIVGVHKNGAKALLAVVDSYRGSTDSESTAGVVSWLSAPGDQPRPLRPLRQVDPVGGFAQLLAFARGAVGADACSHAASSPSGITSRTGSVTSKPARKRIRTSLQNWVSAWVAPAPSASAPPGSRPPSTLLPR